MTTNLHANVSTAILYDRCLTKARHLYEEAAELNRRAQEAARQAAAKLERSAADDDAAAAIAARDFADAARNASETVRRAYGELHWLNEGRKAREARQTAPTPAEGEAA